MSVEGTITRRSHDDRQQRAHAVRDLLASNAGTALMVGGLLWVVTYAVEILIGVRLGEATYASPETSDSWLVWLWPAAFVSATFFLGAGVLGVALGIGRRGRVLAVLGGVLAVIAVAASAVNLVRLTGVVGESTASDDLGFLGVVGVLGGSILVGCAAIRGKSLPRMARLTLALLPLAFIPAIIATIPLEGVAPDYVVADLPFPVVGLVLAAVGLTLRKDRG